MHKNNLPVSVSSILVCTLLSREFMSNFDRDMIAPYFRPLSIGICGSTRSGVYNLLLLPAALLLFIWSTAANEFELYLWDKFN